MPVFQPYLEEEKYGGKAGFFMSENEDKLEKYGQPEGLKQASHIDVYKRQVIDKVNKDDTIHGVLMFRPLPAHLKAVQSEIENALDPAKDVDCMTHLSLAGVFEGKPLGFPPCTPQACMEILDYYGIDCKGKNAVVIGRSLVVGKPAAMMLMGKNATVTVCHTKTVDVPAIAREADILISCAGVLNSLTKEYVLSLIHIYSLSMQETQPLTLRL